MKLCALLLVLSSLLTPRPTGSVVVAFGDSITFGVGAPAGMSWPAQLARLLHHPVLNRGIPGNTLAVSRLRCLPCGTPGSRRFARDVLAVPHVGLVIVALGVNDLLQGTDAARLPPAYLALIAAAHRQGIRIVALTLTANHIPGDAGLEPARLALNRWLASAPFDAVIDLSGVDAFSPDGLHPNAQGYADIARAVAARLG